VNISVVLSIGLMVGLFFFKRGKMSGLIKFFPSGLKLYTIAILISIIYAVLVFQVNYTDLLLRYFKGFAIYGVMLIAFVCTIAMREKKEYIIKGLLIGFLVNIMLSVIQLITYRMGNVFTLFTYYPQDTFYIPIFRFRAQGFFLEPSHMLQYLTTTALLFLNRAKSIMKIFFVYLSFIFLAFYTSSGNVMILVFIILAYLILKSNKGRHRKTKQAFIFSIISLSVIIFVGLLSVLFWDRLKYIFGPIDIGNAINEIVNGADLGSEENEARYTNMLYGLGLIYEYPFGVGYNMSSSLLQIQNNFNSTLSTFNFLISNQLELGILGTFAYCLFTFQLGVKLLRDKRNTYRIALGLSVIAIFGLAVGNGMGFSVYMWIVYALAAIELYDIQEEIRLRNVKMQIIG